MKRFTSIKTRITIWYTSLMFVLIAVVLTIVGMLSYQMSMDTIKHDIKREVSMVSEQFQTTWPRDVIHSVAQTDKFKHISIHQSNGEYIDGQYLYKLADIPFVKEELRREIVDGEEYIIYDDFQTSCRGDDRGYWIRGAESANYAEVLEDSMVFSIVIIIPIILLLTAVGGYYITKKAFMPIDNMINIANKISTQNDVTLRIEINPEDRQDELHNLSLTLNHMLDKIENLINKEKQFTSDASHELRTPVSVILAQGEYLLDIVENEKEKELAESIVIKANQISELVSRLLFLARMDQNRQKLDKVKVNLSALVDMAVDSMSDLAATKDIRLIVNIQESIHVEANETLLLSVMTNLISNGIKYGIQSGHVTISASNHEDATEIMVSDNGIGIAKEHLDNVWRRFYRIDDVRNDEYGSSGLGLAMVKSIIELHGGEISVKSEPGKGTEFRIILN